MPFDIHTVIKQLEITIKQVKSELGTKLQSLTVKKLIKN